MAYTKLTWINYPNLTTPLSAANMNHLETQYDEATTDLTTHKTNATGDGVHRWTDEKILKGAGSGANPEEIDKWGINKIISANLRNSHDAELSTQSTNSILAKTMTMNEKMGGTITIKFDLKSSNVAATAFGQLKKNGVNIGTQQDTTSTSYVTKSQDISIGAMSPNDTLELWYNISNGTYYCFIRNFRLYYDDDATVISMTNS